ncbi:MAG: dimethylaniline monooxygenase, partial [Rhizobiaceae bacterium]|nr:dimethylaniline monooxygenase [Rhizobiaceae bacterium]
ARWISYCFAGVAPMPSQAEMAEGVARARAMRAGPPAVPMHVAALGFARNAGVDPDLSARPDLERALLFGPLSAVSFRLDGADALPDAALRVQGAAAAFGAVTHPAFTAEEQAIRGLVRREALSSAA